jgi:hypothetical protein
MTALLIAAVLVATWIIGISLAKAADSRKKRKEAKEKKLPEIEDFEYLWTKEKI